MISKSKSDNQTDKDFCWEQAVRVRPWLRLSLPYAPKENRDRLLALYALFAALEETIYRVKEEHVAKTKIAWWYSQLSGPEFTSSEHPVVRQLRNTGAIEGSNQGYITNLLQLTAARLDQQSPVDINGLKSLCIQVACSQLNLERGSVDREGSKDGVEVADDENICAFIGFAQLLRESVRSETQGYGWVPLNLLAEYNLSKDEIIQVQAPEKTQQLISALLSIALAWAEPGPNESSAGRSRVHYLVDFQLQHRQIRKLNSRSFPEAAQVFSETTMMDAWFAWRCARRFINRVNYDD